MIRPNYLKCPQCIESGQRSKVYDQGGSTWAMGWSPYYDEDGQYHAHNPNSVQVAYKCTNDHTFQRVYEKPCPNENCEYGKGEQ